jgi:hypothetical protein
MARASLADVNYWRLVLSSAAHAARCVACHGVGSHTVSVALVGELLHPGRVERGPPAAFVEHALFDDLIRPPQQRLRNREPERFGSLEIDDELELRGLLHREVARFGALEDLVHVGGGAVE